MYTLRKHKQLLHSVLLYRGGKKTKKRRPMPAGASGTVASRVRRPTGMNPCELVP